MDIDINTVNTCPTNSDISHSSDSIIETVRRAFLQDESEPASAKKPREHSPLTLAYIGDTVYDLFVRAYLIENTDFKAHGLHMLSKRMVCAAAQAKAFESVKEILTDDERDAFRRGRNAHIGTVPKHATILDYRTATGFEALLGFLLLSGRDLRIVSLMRLAISATSPLLTGDGKD